MFDIYLCTYYKTFFQKPPSAPPSAPSLATMERQRGGIDDVSPISEEAAPILDAPIMERPPAYAPGYAPPDVPLQDPSSAQEAPLQDPSSAQDSPIKAQVEGQVHDLSASYHSSQGRDLSGTLDCVDDVDIVISTAPSAQSAALYPNLADSDFTVTTSPNIFPYNPVNNPD